jgi:hypothetical protein
MTNDWEVAGGNLLGNTIIRVHLKVMAQYTALGTRFQLGLIIGRQADVGLTSTALAPDGVNSRDLPWMLNTRLYAQASAATVDAQVVYEWDLKSRRVQKQLDERLLFCIESSAASQVVTPFARILVALP